MKEMLRIGEVADLMGISVQTLRYYSKIDLLQPTSIDESTGYRYYSVDQIHFLDRIKYLQNFELSLKEIKEILDSNDISMLLDTMQKRQDELKVEAQKIQNAIENIEWYKHYFTYIDSGYKNHLSIIRNLPERYMIVTKCDKEKSKKNGIWIFTSWYTASRIFLLKFFDSIHTSLIMIRFKMKSSILSTLGYSFMNFLIIFLLIS